MSISTINLTELVDTLIAMKQNPNQLMALHLIDRVGPKDLTMPAKIDAVIEVLTDLYGFDRSKRGRK